MNLDVEELINASFIKRSAVVVDLKRNGIMDMARCESRRKNEFVESVTYVAHEPIRHNTSFNIIYIMRTVLYGAGGLWRLYFTW